MTCCQCAISVSAHNKFEKSLSKHEKSLDTNLPQKGLTIVVKIQMYAHTVHCFVEDVLYSGDDHPQYCLINSLGTQGDSA